MKSSIFVASITRSAVLTSLAGVCLMPQDYVGVNPQPLKASDTTTASGDRFQEAETITTSGNVSLTVPQTPREWSKANEKEFRRLALKEATGVITSDEMRRLNWMGAARDHVSSPLSAEEVLLQIRRDRVLEKMAEALKEYVQFNESTGHKGTASS